MNEKNLSGDQMKNLEERFITATTKKDTQQLMAILRMFQIQGYDVREYINRAETRFQFVQDEYMR